MPVKRVMRIGVHISIIALVLGFVAGLVPTVQAQEPQLDAAATVLEWTADGPDGTMVVLDASYSTQDFTEFSWWEDCAAWPCDGGTLLVDAGASHTAEVLLSSGDHSITLAGRSDSIEWTTAPAIIVTVLPAPTPTETIDVTETPEATATEEGTVAVTEEPAGTPEPAIEATEVPTEEVDLAGIGAIVSCDSLTSLLTNDLGTWDLTQTRTGGHNELVAGGLHVWTESNTSEDKAAGYYAVSFPLAEIGVPSIEIASYTGGRPSLQIAVDIDNNGSFDGFLVYEPWAYGEGNYWATQYFGVEAGLGYPSFGTLEDFYLVNPNAQVVAIGYSLGSGLLGDAVISSITVGCVVYTFDVPPPCDVYGQVFTNDLGTWDLSQTRTSGHNELVPGGLHVWTESNTSEDKAAGYYAVSFPLSEAGVPSIEFASYTGGRPSLQLGVDIDNNGVFDGYLVYEPWAYGDGNYWANQDFGVGAGLGYPSFGTLADYVAANPNAVVISIGYSLGSGLLGDAVITKITAGCVEYTFDVPPPRPRIFIDPNPVVPGENIIVRLTDFDPNDTVLIRWRVGSSWVPIGTVSTDGNGDGLTPAGVPLDVAAGLNSVRGDGATKAQQTNAVIVVGQGPLVVDLSTTRATVNSNIGFTVDNAVPDREVWITWRRPGGSTVDLGFVTADSSGVAAGTFKVPATEGGPGSQVIFETQS